MDVIEPEGVAMAFVNAYDRALDRLVRRTAQLGREVERMLRDAMAALVRQDATLARAILERDDWVDDEDAGIEADVLDLISLQQPRQPDLRMLTALLRVGRDLERIADYSCDIAEVALMLAPEPYFKPLVDLPRLGALAADMVHDAVAALESRDIERAEALNRQDDRVDALYAELHQELVHRMEEHPEIIAQASQLTLVARYLERIADHAVNIAEMTVFQVRGGRGRPFHQAHQDPAASAGFPGSDHPDETEVSHDP
jgi:phosphate transport system protein